MMELKDKDLRKYKYLPTIYPQMFNKPPQNLVALKKDWFSLRICTRAGLGKEGSTERQVWQLDLRSEEPGPEMAH